MATLGDMQTFISAALIDTQNTSVSVSQITNYINSAIKYWKFRRFWFNEIEDTATLTPQVSLIPLPADFLVPSVDNGGFEIAYSNYRYILKKTNAQNFDAWFLENGYGLPRVYAKLADNGYHVYPIPDRDYTIRRFYLRDYTNLVNAGDSNDFTEKAERLIEFWALSELMAQLRQDLPMAEYYDKKANDEFRQLGVMTRKTNAAGSLTLTSTMAANAPLWN
jgi:hypothetical protein